MLKKSTAAAMAVMLLFVLHFSAHASQHAPSAVLTETKNTSDDCVFIFDVAADSYVLDNEKTRASTLEQLRSEGKADAEIPAVLLNPIEITVKAETAFGTTGLAKSVSVDSNTVEVSLINDIMPSLVKENTIADGRLLNGFDFTLSFCYTVSDGSTKTELANDTFGASEKTPEFHAPELFCISYDLPDDAENSPNNICFGFAPSETNITLYAPSRSGFTFTGWTNSGGEYVGEVPAGTKFAVLTSNWENRTFAIKFVLTTANGYNFKRVDNSANPTSFSPSDGAKIVAPSVPDGWRFMGWTDKNGAAVTEIPKGTLEDAVLYAVWLTEDEYIDKQIKDANWCDIDSDGSITVKDARAVLRAAVEIEELPEGTLSRVDFAGQGRADVTQARFILRVAVGLDTVRGILEYYEYEFK